MLTGTDLTAQVQWWGMYRAGVEADIQRLSNRQSNTEHFVTDFINKCTDKCVPTKTIQMYRNQKPWMNEEVHNVLRTGYQAFKSGDTRSYRKSWHNLNKAIKKGKWD